MYCTAAPYIADNVSCTVYRGCTMVYILVQCTSYTRVHCTMYTVQWCTLYNGVHCTTVFEVNTRYTPS